MKKYLIVCWNHYYPEDGLCNIRASFDTWIECADYILENRKEIETYDYFYIYDRDTMRVIKKLKTR